MLAQLIAKDSAAVADVAAAESLLLTTDWKTTYNFAASKSVPVPTVAVDAACKPDVAVAQTQLEAAV